MRHKPRIGFLLVVLWLAVKSAAAAPVPLPSGGPIYFPLLVDRGNQKHGLAWSYGSLDRDAWSKYQITWYYHWSSKPWGHVPSFIEFVPMVWCDGADLWDRAVVNIPADFSGYILLANEPEFPTQCGASAQRVAELVYRARQMWPRAQLVAPQTHVCWWEDSPPVPPCGVYGERFTVQTFIRVYREKYGVNPPLVAYGVHYGDPVYWVERLGRFLDSQGIDALLWYSEFNYCGEDMTRFQLWLDFLEQSERVLRYAYWSNLREDNQCALGIYPGGLPTERGRVYAGFGE